MEEGAALALKVGTLGCSEDRLEADKVGIEVHIHDFDRVVRILGWGLAGLNADCSWDIGFDSSAQLSRDCFLAQAEDYTKYVHTCSDLLIFYDQMILRLS